MKRQLIAEIGTVAVLAIVVAGCAANTSSAVMPGVHLLNYRSAYVSCHPADNAGICELIAREFRTHGWDAVAGPQTSKDQNVDVVVTYEDRWTWDITMYLLTLRIDLRDPRTDLLLATGHIYRTSLARETPEHLTRDLINAILAKN